MTSSLALTATRRLKLAFADSTSKSYESKFRNFLSFCAFASIDIYNISPLHILSFLEFLNFNSISHSGLLNYLSAIKSSLAMYGLNPASFSDPRIKMYNKAIMRHQPLNTCLKPIIDTDTLQAMALQCDRMHMGHICKAAILLAFFSPLCPVAAVKKLLSSTSGSNNSPLFQVQCFDKWVPLTDTRLRKFLAKLLKALNLTPWGYTFHSLRRSGATLAFNLNVPMQDIQSHGTWTSEAVWAYVTQDHNAADTVAHTFHSLLHV